MTLSQLANKHKGISNVVNNTKKIEIKSHDLRLMGELKKEYDKTKQIIIINPPNHPKTAGEIDISATCRTAFHINFDPFRYTYNWPCPIKYRNPKEEEATNHNHAEPRLGCVY